MSQAAIAAVFPSPEAVTKTREGFADAIARACGRTFSPVQIRANSPAEE